MPFKHRAGLLLRVLSFSAGLLLRALPVERRARLLLRALPYELLLSAGSGGARWMRMMCALLAIVRLQDASVRSRIVQTKSSDFILG